MPSTLARMAYIQQQNEAGLARGKENRLAGLYQQALSSPRDQRQGVIAQMAGVNPQAAFDANKHFESFDENGRQRLGQYASAFDALPDEMKAQAYPQLAKQAQELGIPAPTEWNPAYAPHIQKLAQSLGGGSGASVQSTKIGEDGFYYTVDRSGRWTNSGVKADPRVQFRDQPGIDPGFVNLRDRTITPVNQQQPQQPGQIQYTTGDGQSIPQDEMAAFQAAVRADAQGQDFNIPVGGQSATTGVAAARPAVAPAEMARLSLAAAANQRAEEANQRAAEASRLAQRGNAPAGFRFKADGSLEPIPGGPKPAGAAASEDERKAAAWLAQATNAYGNMEKALRTDPEADDPGLIETYSPFEELGNRSRSDTRQQYVQAAESLSESLLRAATGAGINEHEAKQKVYELTPRRGDSDAVKRQKMAAIPVYLQALRARAGRAVPQGGQGGGATTDSRKALLDKY